MTKPIENVRCEDCRFAVVGRGEVCHCEMGHWEAVSLGDMPRHNWLRCADYDDMREED